MTDLRDFAHQLHWRVRKLALVWPILCIALISFAGQASSASMANRLSEWRGGTNLSCHDIANMNKIEQSARSGNVDAQVFMAWSFWQGNQCGISANDSQSKKWLQLAADQDDAEAQLALAYYYEYGIRNEPLKGLSSDQKIDVGGGLNRSGKDNEQAWNWIVRSANQGYAPALAVAAKFNFLGKYVPTNKSEAYNLYMLAAERGYSDGYYGAFGVIFGTVQTAYIMKNTATFDEGSVIAMWLHVVGDEIERPFKHRLPHAETFNRVFVDQSFGTLKDWMSPEQRTRARQRADETLNP